MAAERTAEIQIPPQRFERGSANTCPRPCVHHRTAAPMCGDKPTRRNLTKLYKCGNLRVRFADHTFCYGAATGAEDMRRKHQTGRLQMRSRTVLALSVAIVLGAVSSQAFAAGKKPHVSGATASASAATSGSPMDALFVQHRDKGWDHNYQSWCDVDPACNGWNGKMQAVEGRK